MSMIVIDPRTGRAVLSPEPTVRGMVCTVNGIRAGDRQPTRPRAGTGAVPSPAALELLVVRPLGQHHSRPVCGPPGTTPATGVTLVGDVPMWRPKNRTASGLPRDWYRITVANKAGDDDRDQKTRSAEVYIYAEIGESWWGDSVPASQFVREFDALDVDEISVRINSPGGDVMDGLAILNAIRRHTARVTVTIDGIAASAAAFIAMGGDEVIMAANSQMMIHDGRMLAWGDAADLQAASDYLDKSSDNIASIFAAKAGGDAADWRAAMIAETWYSDQEAVDAGLADRIDTGHRDPDAERPEEDPDDQAPDPEVFDLSGFRYAGRAHAPTPRFPARNGPPGAQPPTNSQPEKGSAMTDTADETQTGPADNDPGPQATQHPPVPEGMVLLDEETYHNLQADATAGREARNQQIAEHRTQVVDAAVQDGRIPPARRQHWVDQLTADPEAEQVLADLKPGLVPLEPKGYTGGVDESTDDDLFIRAGWGQPAETTQGA